MKRTFSIFMSLVMIFALFSAIQVSAAAEWVPEKNISLVIPYGAGDGIDILTRALVDNMDVPVNVVIENISGGGGSIGAMEAFNRPSDGYTILCMANSPAISQTILNDTITYNTFDWAVLAEMSARCGLAMCVNPKLGLKSSEEVKEYLESGKEFTFGVPQMSGGVYVAAASSLKAMGIFDNCQFVSYDGIPALYQAYLAGEVDFAGFDDNLALGYEKDNPDVQTCLILGGSRSVFYPDVPCVADWGYEGLEGNVILKYLCVKADTPADEIEYLRNAVVKAIETETYQQWVAENDFGDYPVVYTPEETDEALANIKNLYVEVFTEAGLIA